MEFEQKIFNKDDNSPEKKEYEVQKIWFMLKESPFNLTSILFMNKEQRDKLFEWVLLSPKNRPLLNIEGYGSSQKEFEKNIIEILNNIFPQHVPKGVSNGKHSSSVVRKRTA